MPRNGASLKGLGGLGGVGIGQHAFEWSRVSGRGEETHDGEFEAMQGGRYDSPSTGGEQRTLRGLDGGEEK